MKDDCMNALASKDGGDISYASNWKCNYNSKIKHNIKVKRKELRLESKRKITNTRGNAKAKQMESAIRV